MEIYRRDDNWILEKENEEIGLAKLRPTEDGGHIPMLVIAPEWRRRGYGSYLMKYLLAQTGGFSRDTASRYTAPTPTDAAGEAFLQKFGFVPGRDGFWVRQRKPDLTAVQLAQQFLAAHCPQPNLCVDATCGNGGDTAFLYGLGGRVLAMDVQPAACESTSARLRDMDADETRWQVICDSHANLLNYVQPGTADIVMFNFGWLPGADHSTFSTAESSIPALQAALDALRTGGILSAILYSGKVIGSDEKQAVLDWLHSLPLTKYTVLVCDFANWADTAPLPCFVLKK